ncbi:MAG TPA: acyltransferase [Elusimicrobiota bacterium]|nr:acyltransferase [Elusimicrobiota bacterium]
MSWKRTLMMKTRAIVIPVIRFLKYYSYQTYYCEGDGGTLHLGDRVRLANALLNIESGSIFIGDNTVFGYNVMVLTGRHAFRDGMRASLSMGGGGDGREVPRSGYDIHIGRGCWIASGAVITGGVRIGDNVLVAANAVVTKDVPDHAIAAGVPAKVIGDTRNRQDAAAIESKEVKP